MDKLTGKTRLRTNIFGQVIVQVQYEETIHTDTFYTWRDAKVTDLKVAGYGFTTVEKS